MERKATALYKAVLEKVKELVSNFQLSQVIADFEKAPTAALREVFRDCFTVLVPLCTCHHEATEENRFDYSVSE